MGANSSAPAGSLLYPSPAEATIGYNVSPNANMITTPFESSTTREEATNQTESRPDESSTTNSPNSTDD